MFIRKLKKMSVKFFAASRNVTSFDFYPLNIYKGGDIDEIRKLRSLLERRGNIWKSLDSEAPSCRCYDGLVRRAKGRFVRKEG
jgi:hypothetical protein